jgi:hypothetical protein
MAKKAKNRRCKAKTPTEDGPAFCDLKSGHATWHKHTSQYSRSWKPVVVVRWKGRGGAGRVGG